jgi:hypothetical protein
MPLLPPCSVSSAVYKPCEEVMWSYNHPDPHAKNTLKVVSHKLHSSTLLSRDKAIDEKKIGY